MNIKQTILFILLCSPLISYSQINYTENFDTQGEPNATNNLGWSYTTQIYPAQSTWNDIVPGDGYAYLTVDADTGNDTNPQFAYQTISLSTVPPNHRLEVRMKGAAVQGLVGFIFTYNENQTFNEVDIEIVPDDEGTAPDGHDILAPNGWTDVRINSWRNASPTTFLPTVNTNSAIKDANGNSVSHIDGEFHTYTIDWYENSIDFFIDDVWQNTISQHVAAGESDVILGFRDLAWDGDLNWAGTKTLIIDYLKVESISNTGQPVLYCTDMTSIYTDADCDLNNGSITFSDLNTVPHWELYLNGNYITSDQGNTYTISNLSSGLYYYEIIGYTADWSQNCSKYFTTSVDELGCPLACNDISYTSTAANCETNNGTITFSNLNSVPHWELYLNGNYLAGDLGNNYTISNVSNGTYNYEIIGYSEGWSENCFAPFPVVIQEENCTNCDIIDSQGFENNIGIWNDGGSDCGRVSFPAYSIGNYSMRLRDNTASSVMTTDALNLTAYDELTVNFSYYCRSMDNASEDFWLQISNNGGSSFSTKATWNKGDEFENNNRYNESVTIQGPFAANSKIRFRCHASGKKDWVYIDKIIMTGCSNVASRTATPSEPLATKLDEKTQLISNLKMTNLYPNPARDLINIDYSLEIDAEVQLTILDLTGKVVYTQSKNVAAGKQSKTIDLSEFEASYYFFVLETDKERFVEKIFVIK
jgi:hypothetical protein